MPASQAQGIFCRRRARQAPPARSGRNSPVRQARSNECRARQFADPGHYPGAAPPRGGAAPSRIRNLLGGIDKPGVSVLKELLEQAATACTPSTAMLLERWRDRPEYERLTELAMLDPWLPRPPAAAKELKMAVEKLLEEYGPGRRMDELLKKSGGIGLELRRKGRIKQPSQVQGPLPSAALNPYAFVATEWPESYTARLAF